jgi:hypothetical protein
VTVIAIIRPDSWNFPLLVHVLGATVLVGSLALALVMLAAARNGDALIGVRLGFRTLLLGALPGYLVMRGGAEWIADKEGINDLKEDPSWIGIGYGVGDGTLLLLIIAMVLTGVSMRRANAGTGVKIAAGLVAFTIVAYGVAIWAMTTKPV